MLNVDQYYLNQIAAQGKLKFGISQRLFSASTDETELQSKLYWMQLRNYVQDKGLESIDSETAASILMQLIALYLENEAISNYILDTNSYFLRIGLPEILSPEEGLLVLQGDYMSLNPDEWPIFIEALNDLENRLFRTDYGNKQRETKQITTHNQTNQATPKQADTPDETSENGAYDRIVTIEHYETLISKIKAEIEVIDKEANKDEITIKRYDEFVSRMQVLLFTFNRNTYFAILGYGCFIAEYHISRNEARFEILSKKMIASLGEKIKPYLKAIYITLLHYPGSDAKNLDSYEYVTNFDITTLKA